MNTLNPNTQFTMEYRDTSVPFFDVKVIKHEINILTDIFYKPTETQQYLNFKSCHPTHNKRSIPYNLIRRICTIVKDENAKDQRLAKLITFLTVWSYLETLVVSAIMKLRKFHKIYLEQRVKTIMIFS